MPSGWKITRDDGNAHYLAKGGKVQLVGVLFDFDKATLKPASTPVLEKTAALIKARPKLALELSGHTDNVGNDAYNDKLSQRQPIADNESDGGRAQNRRVQLACVR